MRQGNAAKWNIPADIIVAGLQLSDENSEAFSSHQEQVLLLSDLKV